MRREGPLAKSRKRRSSFGSIEKIGAVYYLRWSQNGRRMKRRAGRTEAQAERKRVKVHALVLDGRSIEYVLREVFGEGPPDRLTFEQAAAIVLTRDKREKRRRDYLIAQNRMELVLATANWAGRYLDDVRPKDIRAWLEGHVASGRFGPASANRYLSAISTVFRWAIDEERAAENPALKVRRRREPTTQRVGYTAEQVAALIAGADAHFRPIVILAANTLLRRGELCGLAVADVDLEENLLTVRSEIAKNHEARVVPLNAPALTAARELMGRHKVRRMDRADPLLLTQRGRPYQAERLGRRFRKLLLACDAIPAALKTIPAGSRQARLSLHSFRHSLAFVAEKHGDFLVAQMLGHAPSSIRVTARYLHTRTRQLVEPFGLVGEVYTAALRELEGGAADEPVAQ